MQDIFHQESLSEILKEDGKLSTHSLFKDTIGIEKYIYTIKNVEERNTPCQVNMSSYLYHPFIHSFCFISLISFPGLRGVCFLYGPKRFPEFGNFRPSPCVTSIGKVGKICVRYWLVLWSIGQKGFEQVDWVWGRRICADVAEGVFEICVHLQIKVKQNIFRLWFPIFVDFASFF